MISLILNALLLIVVIRFAYNIFLMHKSLLEIINTLDLRLNSNSNRKITVSSRDRYILRLASELNTQLSSMRTQELRFMHGDKMLKETVANISHDLRTPLTTICGHLELLKAESLSDDTMRHLSIIETRTEALRQLTEELFIYSNITTPLGITPQKAVDLTRLLEKSIVAFYESLRKRSITPEINLHPHVTLPNLDEKALSRVFDNLLNNALKYSDGDLSISLTQSGDITFSNTASSLNEIRVGKLFDRYYSVDDATQSTGLGLAISKTLLEEMDATIIARYQANVLSITISFT